MSATRLPGKPLLKIDGMSIISHVFKKAEGANIGEVVVATEDQEIMDIKALDMKMKTNNSEIGTLASIIPNQEMFEDENVVKIKIKEPFNKNSFPYAQNFMRKTKDKTNVFHHIGIYCYGVQTLKKFISFDQTQNELENKLEQLRALDNKININVALAKKSPIGVDTQEDYIAIKKIMKYK